jgi:DNA-binding transcriptional LysR family regulator
LQVLFPLLEDLTQMLENGDADLGICFQPQQLPEQFIRWPLQQLQFAAAVSTAHPLATLADVTTADLQQHRQLMVTGRGESLEKQRGRLSSQVWWLEGDIAVLALVEQHLGWAWLPLHVLQPAMLQGKIKLLPISCESAQLPLQLELWQLREKTLGPAGLWLRQRLLRFKG